ncbi:MAG: hypothetical protein CML87_05595, partial [Rhodobiaceae bacterium]|nr:hypothetical protein [Rhodobiaceae bacterium]
MNHILEDILVIDCASYIAGPAAATIMSDFGARVVKVEPPDAGDSYRGLIRLPGLPEGGGNYPWTLTSRNKESLAMDLKEKEAQEILNPWRDFLYSYLLESKDSFHHPQV